MPMTVGFAAGARRRSPPQLLAHVELVEFLDSVPIEVEFLSHGFHGCVVAAAPNHEDEPLGVVGKLRQPIEALGLDLATAPTKHAANLQREVNMHVAATEVANPTRVLIVESGMHLSALATDCFFRRRRKGRTMLLGSPG